MELVRRKPAEFVTREVELCRCGLPTTPPIGINWWRPDQDAEPGPRIRAVVRCGDRPDLRRLERASGSDGWTEQGVMVSFYEDRTPPMSWSDVGQCWAGTQHPVVAVREDGAGHWQISA